MQDPFDLPPESPFWEFLQAIEILDEAAVEEFKAEARHNWRPLGEILMRQGVLSRANIADLLTQQVDEPMAPLGDLAIRKGLCTQADIQNALEIQKQFSPHPIELVSCDSRIDPSSLFGAILGYVKFLERRLQEQAPAA